jgi:peptidyl-dipeptidase Dcp
MQANPVAASASDQPFAAEWETPFGLPPFERIAPDQFELAFARAMEEHRQQIDAIAGNPTEPSFDNAIAALEMSGRRLRRVSAVFFNLASAHTNDALQAIEREMAPRLAKHRNDIFMNETLFRRVEALHGERDTLGLSPEKRRVLDRYYTIFTRAGARLAPHGKKRLAEITERLATLGTQFSQNVLADERGYTLLLESDDDLAGLPDFVRAAAAQAAAERGLAGKHVITLSRSSIEPFLQFSRRRDLREQAFRAWIGRGDTGGTTDNKAIVAEMVALRAERAKLLGFATFAHFKLDDMMARTPAAVLELLDEVWAPARIRAEQEADALQGLVHEEGGNFELAPWDWRYYAEKLRQREHDFDEAQIKPYLQLDKIIEAAFHTATRLFGLRFKELHGLPVYHPEVRVWEVLDESGRHVGVFLGDYFARPSKRSGAWASSYRTQEKLAGEIRPIIVNVMNFSKGAEGAPALLSFDDARTLFHEFGHALHGLLSNVTFPLIAGTNVATDFVELPSQLYEHWLSRPEVLGGFAVHYQTGEPMPKALLERMLAARNFHQGFATVEYVASAMVDMEFHLLSAANALDVAAFEKDTLDKIGMPKAIVMRHRTPHFAHVFSGDGYSAGYYSYLWSEVLDADGFKAFEETGDVFDPGTAQRLKQFVYSAGYLREPAEAYRAFRGRDPNVAALLEKRGFRAAAMQPSGEA